MGVFPAAPGKSIPPTARLVLVAMVMEAVVLVVEMYIVVVMPTSMPKGLA